ncbi:MAG: S-layer homology domain-containing protein [Oscillospiraceae bacterium]|nr:S-layer homology domain-containing protein [Oscillospiraceae bacterium]MBQ9985232.1 S-layer homology domain-containing protein [Oscillospiraceae bacterium]
MKKRLLGALLAMATVSSLFASASASDAKAAYTDVPESHWAHGEIMSCTENGIFNGFPDESFRPSDVMTREDAATAIKRQFKNTDFSAFLNSNDKKGAITREEAAYLISKAKGYENSDELSLDKFSDKSEISGEYKAEVSAAVSEGLILGHSDKTFRPKVTLTRGEFAVLLYRAVYGEEILAERRAKAYDYMFKSTSLLWSPTEDILYTTQKDVKPEEAKENVQFTLHADRIYHGTPYSYAGGTSEAFLDYAIEQDENGVYLIDGLTWENISGGSGNGRIGNDCSSVLLHAYGQLGETYNATTTAYLTEKYGFLPVGNYKTVYDKYVDTGDIIKENGEQVIFRAYSRLKLADAIVERISNSGHCRMVKEVKTVYLPDGTIDGEKSTMTLIDQAVGSYKREETYFNEKLGQDVYKVGREETFNFATMASWKFIPITCRALIDPAPIAKPAITDTEKVFDKDAILKGTLTCNWMMDCVTLDIADAAGEAVQSATAYVSRKKMYTSFDMQEFVTVNPALVRGSVDVNALEEGNYNCKVTVRLVTGEEITVRDFEFVK